ncbi:hypothetical protein [Vibrio parahaemolyticus]|uniref:hypothetical protein n=1 Tax=Vibrio parahaemolyticus TaxID=670 RepID=UPI00215C2F44|nr:hypothetical protein [Vibrio parahaemolyticus]MCS0013322.1 hypothetical protein [Vibrio parahaemolyticus]
MKKLRVPYDIIGDREAAMDSVRDEMQTFSFTAEYDKLKKTLLSLSTFSIFMVSFNITTPLTISTGVASVSVGNLTLFFVLLFIYQLYTLKCLRDEFDLLSENSVASLKQTYYFYLLCRRAALKFKEQDLVKNNADFEFTMHGIQIGRVMHHAPALTHEFQNENQLDLWREKLSADFSFHKLRHSNKWQIFLSDAKTSDKDIEFWHKNKKRLLTKRKPVHNHYYIPLVYSALGLITTLMMIFPKFREWIVALF